MQTDRAGQTFLTFADACLSAEAADAIGKDFNDSIRHSFRRVGAVSFLQRHKAARNAIGTSMAQLSATIQGTSPSNEELDRIAAGCTEAVKQSGAFSTNWLGQPVPGWHRNLWRQSLGVEGNPTPLADAYQQGRDQFVTASLESGRSEQHTDMSGEGNGAG